MSGLADRSSPAAALDPHARLPADQIIAGLDTKADQIRALAQAGYLRTEIAAQLNIRYQHVRQVLERSGIDLGRSRDGGPAPRMMRQPSPPKETSALSPAEPLIDLDRLIAAGFVRIGQWTAVDDTAFALYPSGEGRLVGWANDRS